MSLHLKQRQDWIKGRREKRQQARQARIRRQLARGLVLLLIVLVVVSGFVLLPWSLTNIDSQVIVEGNQVVADEQVKAILASFIGKPLYKLDPQILEAKVRSLPAVRFAFVRRYVLPRPRLQVTVLEEFPWATFSLGPDDSASYVISEQGRMIPLAQFPKIIQPDLKIYGTRNFKMNMKEVEQWATWLSCIASQTGQKVNCIDLREPQNIWIQDGDLRLKIGVADFSVTRRLSRLASIMPIIGQIRSRLKYVDLSLDNNIPVKTAPATTSSARH